MRFTNVTDLYNYLIEAESKNGPVNYIDVLIEHDKPLSESVKRGTNCIKLLSLFDSPEIQHKDSLSEHEIYVNAYDAIDNACGTGRIELLGREVLLSICECEGNVHVNLDIEVDGKAYSNVPFNVKLTEDANCYIMINKSKL